MEKRKKIYQKGVIISYVLVFGGIFLMLLGGLLGYILLQLRYAGNRVAWNQSLAIAETGIEYYRWCLSHNVQDSCKGVHEYTDVNGVVVGAYNLIVANSDLCGETIQSTITSEGWTLDFPNTKRRVRVLYAKESVAKYAGVTNEGVWFGNNENTLGPFHANGGIRMDGDNQSLVSSSTNLNGVGEWVCDYSFGCDPCPTGAGECRISGGKCLCPSVFTTTANSNPSLFKFPVSSFDFPGISVDLRRLSDKTLAGVGRYLKRSSEIRANSKGWHLKFKNDGTFEAWIVTSVSFQTGWNPTEGDHSDYFTITGEYLYNTYPIPSSCGAIFVEDNVWPEGVIKGKVVLVSANLDDANVDTSAILAKNITLNSSDGSDSFALIAEKNIWVSYLSPDNLELRGIYIAQDGTFYRDYYSGNLENEIDIYGSIVSKLRPNTSWVNSAGIIVSGYLTSNTYYEPNLIYSPPPFVPYVSPNFKIVSWDEID